MGKNIFFLRDDSFNLKYLVLDCLGPTKNDHIDCTILVEKHCGPLYIVHWHFLCSIMREKNGEFFSFLGKSVFFSNSCVLNNLLRPKKWSYYYHSYCQNIFLDPINRFLRFFTLEILKTYRANTFLHWKDCLFFKKICVLHNLLGPKEKIL